MFLSSEEIKQKRILIVGAGGIGCEILKNILLMGFKQLEIIDLDVVDLSNLNRQFLFSKEHIGQPKSVIAAQISKERYGKDAEIKAYHCEIQHTQFNVDYYKSFDVVINALDNLNARKHVNRMCVCANVPLIDGGTSGFLGQTTTIIPKETECYECQPKEAPKQYAVCTIRSNPSTAVHCVFWSKQLLQKLFGNAGDDNYLSEFQFATSENMWREVYDKVFTNDIKELHRSEELWKMRKKPEIWTYEDIMNYEMKSDENEDKKMNELQHLVQLYKSSFEQLQSRYMKEGTFEFDKEDDIMIDFIYACTNIRCEIFHLKGLSKFEVKEKAGNIIPAIPTTNAIISGLMMIEMMKVLSNEKDRLRTIYLAKKASQNHLLQFERIVEPNKECYICGNDVISFECDIEMTTLKDIVNESIEKCGMINPSVFTNIDLLYECGDEIEEDEVEMYETTAKQTLQQLQLNYGDSISIKDDLKSLTFILKKEERKRELQCNNTDQK